jgi:hypothetical protein
LHRLTGAVWMGMVEPFEQNHPVKTNHPLDKKRKTHHCTGFSDTAWVPGEPPPIVASLGAIWYLLIGFATLETA